MNNNNLDSNLIGEPAEQRDEHDLCKQVQRALTLDRFIPLAVDAHVQDGIVTLTGAVSGNGERDDAMILATCVPGVLGVMDKLVLIAAPRPGDADANTEVRIPAPRPRDAGAGLAGKP